MKILAIVDYPTMGDVVEAYPNAAVVEIVSGGWAVFFNYNEWSTWNNQI